MKLLENSNDDKIEHCMKPYVKQVNGWNVSGKTVTHSMMYHPDERFDRAYISGLSHDAPIGEINTADFPIFSPTIYCNIPMVEYTKQVNIDSKNLRLVATYVLHPEKLFLDSFFYWEGEHPTCFVRREKPWENLIFDLFKENSDNPRRISNLGYYLKYDEYEINDEIKSHFRELENILYSNYRLYSIVNNKKKNISN